jgi:uncharacterized protein YggE
MKTLRLLLRFLPLLLGVAVLLFGLLSWQSDEHVALAQQPLTEQSPRSVSTSGIGQVNVRPDSAVIVIGVQTEAAEASTALADNNAQMQAVIDAVSASGVLTDDIQTQVVQLQPQTPIPDPNQPQPSAQVGMTVTQPSAYIASNLIEVRVRDLNNLGPLLDTAVQAGGNRIQSIRFEVSDVEAAMDEARIAAWQDAQRKAEQLAELAGATLGEVLLINDYSATPFPGARADFAAAPAIEGVPVAPGVQPISVNLQITWRLGE